MTYNQLRLPTEREPRTAIFLLFKGSPVISDERQEDKERKEAREGEGKRK
jgi:hypothetical protein